MVSKEDLHSITKTTAGEEEGQQEQEQHELQSSSSNYNGDTIDSAQSVHQIYSHL